MASLQIHVFKDSAASFIEALTENEIAFSRRFQLSEVPMAAGWIVDVFSAVKEATPWGAFAVVLVAWLNAKKIRKVIITQKDNTIVHIEGMSVEEVSAILEKAKDVGVIETPSNSP